MATQYVVSKPTVLVFLLFIVTQAMALGSSTSQDVDEAHCLEAAARTAVAETGENKGKTEEKQEAGKEEASGAEKDAEKNVDDADKKPSDSKGKEPAAGLSGSFIIDDWTTDTESESKSDEVYLLSSDDDDQEAGDDKEKKKKDINDNGSKRRKVVDLNNAPIEMESSSESEN